MERLYDDDEDINFESQELNDIFIQMSADLEDTAKHMNSLAQEWEKEGTKINADPLNTQLDIFNYQIENDTDSGERIYNALYSDIVQDFEEIDIQNEADKNEDLSVLTDYNMYAEQIPESGESYW